MKLEKVQSKLETEDFAFKVKAVPVLTNSHNFYFESEQLEGICR